jgi:hypothetical protein
MHKGKQDRQVEAIARQEQRSRRTLKEQIKLLRTRPGKSTREEARLRQIQRETRA